MPRQCSIVVVYIEQLFVFLAMKVLTYNNLNYVFESGKTELYSFPSYLILITVELNLYKTRYAVLLEYLIMNSEFGV